MPKGVYSRACGTCKSRRVKCDETRPACQACQKSGIYCEPFRLPYSFVDQNDLCLKGASSRRARKETLSSTRSSASTISEIVLVKPLYQTTLPAELRLGFEILTRSALSYYSAGRGNASVFWNVDRTTLTSSLSHAIDHQSVFASYMACLPSRFGQSQILDMAAGCLLRGLAEMFKLNQGTAPGASRRQYDQALQKVRNHLDHDHSVSADLMGAVMLLSIFESVSGSEMSSWMTHIRGLATMFKIRGPTKALSKFEISILFGALGGFVSEALMNNHPCFLADPLWQDVICEELSDKLTSADIFDYTTGVISCLCRLPEILSECQAIIRNALSPKDDQISRLLKKARSLQLELMALSPNESAPLGLHEIPSDGMWYVFNASEQATGDYCNYLMAIAVVNRVILSLVSWPLGLEVECQRLARKVIELHAHLLQSLAPKLTEANQDPGPRNRISHLRIAFSIVNTGPLYRQILDKCPANSCQNEGEPRGGLVPAEIFDRFHDMLRGRALV